MKKLLMTAIFALYAIIAFGQTDIKVEAPNVVAADEQFNVTFIIEGEDRRRFPGSLGTSVGTFYKHTDNKRQTQQVGSEYIYICAKTDFFRKVHTSESECKSQWKGNTFRFRFNTGGSCRCLVIRFFSA